MTIVDIYCLSKLFIIYLFQPVILHLLDIPHCMEKLNGVVMELEDLALSLVRG